MSEIFNTAVMRPDGSIIYDSLNQNNMDASTKSISAWTTAEKLEGHKAPWMHQRGYRVVLVKVIFMGSEVLFNEV
jgi:hypothetical protein